MNNLTRNATYLDGVIFRPAYDTCLSILAVFIIAINVLVVTLFIRKDYLRTKTNSFLVSLAISDLITGILSIPLYLLYPVLQTSACIITSAALYRCIAASTMAHILVVTLERYVAVMYPMRYYRLVTKRRVCFVIGLVWTFSCVYSIIGITWLDFNGHNVKNPQDLSKYDMPYNIAGSIICFFLPLITMTFCFTRMFIVIRRQVKSIRKQAERVVDPRNRSIASDKRALFIFASMLGIFVICWLSWYITLYQVHIGLNAIFPELLADIFDFLRFATSLFNPLLYTFLKHDFRRAVASMCCVEKLTRVLSVRDSRLNNRPTMTTDLMCKSRNKSPSLRLSTEQAYGYEYEHGTPEEIIKKKQPEMAELISHV